MNEQSETSGVQELSREQAENNRYIENMLNVTVRAREKAASTGVIDAKMLALKQQKSHYYIAQLRSEGGFFTVEDFEVYIHKMCVLLIKSHLYKLYAANSVDSKRSQQLLCSADACTSGHSPQADSTLPSQGILLLYLSDCLHRLRRSERRKLTYGEKEYFADDFECVITNLIDSLIGANYAFLGGSHVSEACFDNVTKIEVYRFVCNSSAIQVAFLQTFLDGMKRESFADYYYVLHLIVISVSKSMKGSTFDTLASKRSTQPLTVLAQIKDLVEFLFFHDTFLPPQRWIIPPPTDETTLYRGITRISDNPSSFELFQYSETNAIYFLVAQLFKRFAGAGKGTETDGINADKQLFPATESIENDSFDEMKRNYIPSNACTFKSVLQRETFAQSNEHRLVGPDFSRFLARIFTPGQGAAGENFTEERNSEAAQLMSESLSAYNSAGRFHCVRYCNCRSYKECFCSLISCWGECGNPYCHNNQCQYTNFDAKLSNGSNSLFSFHLDNYNLIQMHTNNTTIHNNMACCDNNTTNTANTANVANSGNTNSCVNNFGTNINKFFTNSNSTKIDSKSSMGRNEDLFRLQDKCRKFYSTSGYYMQLYSFLGRLHNSCPLDPDVQCVDRKDVKGDIEHRYDQSSRDNPAHDFIEQTLRLSGVNIDTEKLRTRWYENPSYYTIRYCESTESFVYKTLTQQRVAPIDAEALKANLMSRLNTEFAATNNIMSLANSFKTTHYDVKSRFRNMTENSSSPAADRISAPANDALEFRTEFLKKCLSVAKGGAHAIAVKWRLFLFFDAVLQSAERKKLRETVVENDVLAHGQMVAMRGRAQADPMGLVVVNLLKNIALVELGILEFGSYSNPSQLALMRAVEKKTTHVAATRMEEPNVVRIPESLNEATYRYSLRYFGSCSNNFYFNVSMSLFKLTSPIKVSKLLKLHVGPLLFNASPTHNNKYQNVLFGFDVLSSPRLCIENYTNALGGSSSIRNSKINTVSSNNNDNLHNVENRDNLHTANNGDNLHNVENRDNLQNVENLHNIENRDNVENLHIASVREYMRVYDEVPWWECVFWMTWRSMATVGNLYRADSVSLMQDRKVWHIHTLLAKLFVNLPRNLTQHADFLSDTLPPDATEDRISALLSGKLQYDVTDVNNSWMTALHRDCRAILGFEALAAGWIALFTATDYQKHYYNSVHLFVSCILLLLYGYDRNGACVLPAKFMSDLESATPDQQFQLVASITQATGLPVTVREISPHIAYFPIKLLENLCYDLNKEFEMRPIYRHRATTGSRQQLAYRMDLLLFFAVAVISNDHIFTSIHTRCESVISFVHEFCCIDLTINNFKEQNQGISLYLIDYVSYTNVESEEKRKVFNNCPTVQNGMLVEALFTAFIDSQKGSYYDRTNYRVMLSNIFVSLLLCEEQRALICRYAERHHEKFIHMIHLLLSHLSRLVEQAVSALSEVKHRQKHKAFEPIRNNSNAGNGNAGNSNASNGSNGDDDEESAEQELPTFLTPDSDNFSTLSWKQLNSMTTAFCVLGLTGTFVLNLFTRYCAAAMLKSTTIRSQLVTTLNCTLHTLVGPSCMNLKIDDMSSYMFNPRNMLTCTMDSYIQLHAADARSGEEFLFSVTQEGRYYDIKNFYKAWKIVRRDGLLIAAKAKAFRELTDQLSEFSSSVDTLDASKRDKMLMNPAFALFLIDNAPEEFIDPLLQEIMLDPVTLPTSGNTVDRKNIEMHLFNEESDPFSREPLTIRDLQPRPDLLAQINAYIDAQIQVFIKDNAAPAADRAAI